jgi:ABC-type antimicrobial peptide transport system permease subunit
MDDIVRGASSDLRFSMMMITCSALLSLALALIGVSGIVSYLIAVRREELGIRLALGARYHHVLRYIFDYTIKFAIIGLAVGIVFTLAAQMFVGRLIYGIERLDAVSVMGALAIVLVTSSMAAYVPSRRALNIEPLSSLRSE